MNRTAQLEDADRELIDSIRDSAAFRQAEADRSAARALEHAAHVKTRHALIAESERSLAKANADHLAALAEVEKAAAALAVVKSRARTAERVAYDASHAAALRLSAVELDLRETADPAIAELRAWARAAFDDGAKGFKKQPGRRTIKSETGRPVAVYKSEEFRAAREFIGAMGREDSGPLADLERADLPPAKLSDKLAELRAEAERLLALALSNDAPGPVAKVVEKLRHVVDVHEARAAARAAAAARREAPEPAAAGWGGR